jgi:hypothetical protein
VKEITPTYYAVTEGNIRAEFELSGGGFDYIPSNAIGILSGNNNEPLMYRNVESTSYILDIRSKSNTRISLRAESGTKHSSPIYLGAILSPDRQVIYWVNNTQPIP